jgi:hypothetical protein
VTRGHIAVIGTLHVSNQDFQALDRGLNPKPREYWQRMLITQLWYFLKYSSLGRGDSKMYAEFWWGKHLQAATYRLRRWFGNLKICVMKVYRVWNITKSLDTGCLMITEISCQVTFVPACIMNADGGLNCLRGCVKWWGLVVSVVEPSGCAVTKLLSQYFRGSHRHVILFINLFFFFFSSGLFFHSPRFHSSLMSYFRILMP